MRCLIIIPAYNEAANIEKVVDNLVQNYPQYDYLVINDGSTDDTGAVCTGLCRKQGMHALKPTAG